MTQFSVSGAVPRQYRKEICEMEPESWTKLEEPIELPKKIVRFHKVLDEAGYVRDTLAVMEDGRSISLNDLFGEPGGKPV